MPTRSGATADSAYPPGPTRVCACSSHRTFSLPRLWIPSASSVHLNEQHSAIICDTADGRQQVLFVLPANVLLGLLHCGFDRPQLGQHLADFVRRVHAVHRLPILKVSATTALLDVTENPHQCLHDRVRLA